MIKKVILAVGMIIAFIFAPAYYMVNVVKPYAERKDQFEIQCEQKGGMVYESKRSMAICIKKDIIKIE